MTTCSLVLTVKAVHLHCSELMGHPHGYCRWFISNKIWLWFSVYNSEMLDSINILFLTIKLKILNSIKSMKNKVT